MGKKYFISDKIDFAPLAQDLLLRHQMLLPDWLPGGRFINGEYCCGSVYGGLGQSFRVNVKTGQWAEFNKGDGDYSGGDLISLYAAIKSISQIDAYNALSNKPVQLKKTIKTEVKPTFEMKGILPSGLWEYRDKESNFLFFIARYDSNGGKDFFPWQRINGNWVSKGYPTPRPLYNLDKICSDTSKEIIICEGEKSAEACSLLVNNKFTTTTWPNGSNSVDKSDWSVLKGRSVIIWPDADDAGKKAGDKIKDILINLNCSVLMVDTSPFPDKWDAADVVANNGKWEDIKILSIQKQKTLKEKISDLTSFPDKSQRVEALKQFIPEISALDKVSISSMFIYICEQLGLSSRHVSELKKACFKSKRIPDGNLRWDMSESGEVLKTFSNAKNFIIQHNLHKNFALNEFSGDIEISGHLPWEDEKQDSRFFDEAMSIKMREFFSDTCRFDISRDTINDVVFAIGYDNKYHPVRDYLNALVWDKTPRLDTWMIRHLHAEDSLYVRDVSRKTLVGAVSRVFKPGITFQHVLILEGKQGLGKTTAIERLAGKWFGAIHIDQKFSDTVGCLKGVWINEIGEMSGMQKKEINELKKFITDTKDRVRMPYARRPEDFPRQWILVGTHNPIGSNTYLKDPTGNRRFWPVECDIELVDFSAIDSERDQLFAEAVVFMNNGEKLFLDNEESRLQHEKIVLARTEVEETLDCRIRAWLEGITYKQFSMSDLLLHFNVDISKNNKSLETKIGIILRELKCRRFKESSGAWKYEYGTK
jgi:predicted P-loop ATPase/5S rRNA maturation endonuclease (ribonuclease M5)